MKSLIWLFLVAGICAAAGCSSSSGATDSQQLPIGFTFESTPGSFASIGWTGLLHDIEEPVGTPFGVKVDGECHVDSQTGNTVCAFKGPVAPKSPVTRKRCAFRMSKICNSDSDCPIDGGKPTLCAFMYDAPISVPLPSAPSGTGLPPIGACAWSYLPLVTADNKQTIDGQLNLTTGDLDLENIDIELPLNYSPTGFYGACAECVGDPTPNDGVKGGVCKHTTHLGASAGIPTGFADDGPDLGQHGLFADGGERVWYREQVRWHVQERGVRGLDHHSVSDGHGRELDGRELLLWDVRRRSNSVPE
jgi:hypothetical protein